MEEKKEDAQIELNLVEKKFHLIVFVGNIADDKTTEDVKNIFMQHSGLVERDIVEVSVFWNMKNNTKAFTFAFVEFGSEAAVKAALFLNGSIFFGRKICVLPSKNAHRGFFIMKMEESSYESGKQIMETQTDIEIGDVIGKDVEGNPPGNIECIEMESEMEVEVVEVRKENETTKCIEGLIREEKPEEEDNSHVVNNCENSQIDDSKIKSNDDDPVHEKSNYVAYLKHLPSYVTEDEILEFYSFIKNDVVSVVLDVRRRESQKQMAVIAFKTEDALQKCLSYPHKLLRNTPFSVEKYKIQEKTTQKKQDNNPEGLNDVNKMKSPAKQENVSGEKNNLELDLFVKHINWKVREQTILDFFSCVGAKVIGVKMFNDTATNDRGMGFITMADEDSLRKGLALDGMFFWGNRIKVSVRSDRRFLKSDVEDESSSNFSVFVGNLPIKKGAGSLRSALFGLFKNANCLTERIHIPLAHNHSGNRGYSFVTFQDENSLKIAMKLCNSKIKLCGYKVNLTVSKNWPENCKDSNDAFVKSTETEYKPGNPSVGSELLNNGKNKKRKRRPNSPIRANFYKGSKETYKKFALNPMHLSSRNQYQTTHNLEYKTYLDYLQSDLYATRMVDDKQNFPEYEVSRGTGFNGGHHLNPTDSQLFFPAVSFGTNTDRAYQESKGIEEGQWRINSSHISSRCIDDTRYAYDLDATDPSIARYVKSVPVSLTSSNCMYATHPQHLQGNGSDRIYSTIPRTSFGSQENDTCKPTFYSNGREAKLLSNSDWISASDPYKNGDKIAVDSKCPWTTANSENYWERRVSNAPTTRNGMNGNECTNLLRSNTSYGFEKTKAYPDSMNSSRISNFSGSRSSALQSSTSDYNLGLFSRFDRRPPTSGFRAAENSSVPYPSAVHGIQYTHASTVSYNKDR